MVFKKEDEEYLERNFDRALSLFQEEKKTIGRAIFVLGTGTFVLSVNFLSNTQNNLISPWSLIASWVFIALSIFTYLKASYLSACKQDAIMDEINETLSKEKFPSDPYSPDETPNVMKFDKQIESFNQATYFFLGLGIALLLIFASLNFLARQTKEERGTAPAQIVEYHEHYWYR